MRTRAPYMRCAYIQKTTYMKRSFLTLILTLLSAAALWAQQLNVLPTLSAASGAYDDQVSVSATFPEGCAGGKYWINGGEIQARIYSEPIVLDYDCALSVAGIDATGRIITDVVTHQYTINRVTPPSWTTQPKEGVRRESFYVTKLQWSHVGSAICDLAPFKTGGERHGENVVWLTGPDGQVISAGDANNLWKDGLNAFKAYIYKNYDQKKPGEYILHIAPSVFVLDGKVYDKELQLHYTVADGNPAPVFSPDGGTYKGSVTVTIDYPEDGSAFYKFYKLNGSKAKQYTAPFALTETTTVEAYGMDEDFTAQTPTASVTYIVTPADPEPEVIDAPVLTRQGNTVSISGPAGTTLKYWMDYSMSTARLYTAPFSVDHNTVVSAVAYRDGVASPAASITIDGFSVDRGDLGEQVLLTPLATETAHMQGLSPNGRYAVGYVGSDTSSKGFVWDIEADDVQYTSTLFINQLWSVTDDGTAYGWRARSTDVDEQTTEDDLLWGTYKDGVWTEMTRAEFNAAIAPDLSGVNVPAGLPAATLISPNGEWAVLGHDYRLNVKTGEAERMHSMSERFSDGNRPEVLRCIADDGTVFGTYTGSSLSAEYGGGLVYTTDGRWRYVSDWLHDTCGLTLLDGYSLSSVCDVTGDAKTLLFHATTRGISSEDTFTRGLLLRINVPVRHLAPATVVAQQMNGREMVKLTWKTPTGAAPDAADAGQRITGYEVSRDGSKIGTTKADVLSFYDETVKAGVTYSYTVVAQYADGTTSAASRPASVICKLDDHLPVRHLTFRYVGLNSLALTWDAPITTLPRLQYFDEESETFAFGTGTWDAEFGIRISAADMATFKGQQIRTFQFLPTGPQKSYTLNLYRGDTGKAVNYDETPFYTQSIDPATLNYGTLNTIELATPQQLPEGVDLYVGLFIESSGNDNMLGVSYEGFRSGYSDLCRIDGVHERMVAISQNSQQTTEVVLPLGLGIASEADYNASIVSNYTVALDGKDASSTALAHHTLEQLAQGVHTVSVTAVYRDGKSSVPETVSVSINDREEAYNAIVPRAEIQSDNSVLLSWDAPRDDDRSLIHWGDLTPNGGWPLSRGLQGFAAISIYPVNMTADYADDYEITEVYFCPMAEGVDYELALGNVDGDILGYVAPQNYNVGEINYFTLPEPVAIDPTVTYQLVVNVPEVEEGTVAIAYDSSGKWNNGFSNLLNYGLGLISLGDIVQIGEYPNWLMGMVVRQKNARPMAVEGYTVTLDGQRLTSTPITDQKYTTQPLADGLHKAAVDVVYSKDRTVKGQPITINVGLDGILDIVAPAPAARRYDLQGKACPEGAAKGITIEGNRKVSRN